MKQIYRIIRLDESETVPYDFRLKADAVKVCKELNDINLTKSPYYVKTIKQN